MPNSDDHHKTPAKQNNRERTSGNSTDDARAQSKSFDEITPTNKAGADEQTRSGAPACLRDASVSKTKRYTHKCSKTQNFFQTNFSSEAKKNSNVLHNSMHTHTTRDAALLFFFARAHTHSNRKKCFVEERVVTFESLNAHTHAPTPPVDLKPRI